ncbi:uncharacterized protein [Clytia hemisphaerica]|uniref:Uncharacterized protein n=1 Tax=Clytia hemisphaerica TaxID=252671 RepID=A0A7M5XMW6_9CNID
MMNPTNSTNATGFPFDTSVNEKLAITFSSITLVMIVILIIIAYYCIKKISCLNLQRTGIIFISIGLTSFLGTILYQSDDVYFICIVILLLVSILFTSIGHGLYFDELPEPTENEENNSKGCCKKYCSCMKSIKSSVLSCLNSYCITKKIVTFLSLSELLEDKKKSSYILPLRLITFIVCVMEIFYIAAAIKEKDGKDIALFILAIIQKLVQIIFYHYRLNRMKAKTNRLRGASWYCKILSLTNFIFWIESMKVTYDRQHEKSVEEILKFFYGFIAGIYTSLVVDYRLIFCILFLEHASKIDKSIPLVEKNIPNTLHDIEKDPIKFADKTRVYKILGFIFGLLIVLIQIINAMHYKDTYHFKIGPGGNVTGMVATFALLVASGFLWKKIHLSNEVAYKKQITFGIDYLMVMMGVVGCLYQFGNLVLISVWANNSKAADNDMSNHLAWIDAKTGFFIIAFVIQIALFVTINMNYTDSDLFKKNLAPHFLIPFILFCILAILCNLISSEYSHHIPDLAEEANLPMIMKLLRAVGSPMGMAFTGHVVVHFGNMFWKMCKYKNEFVAEEELTEIRMVGGESNTNPPLLESRNDKEVGGESDTKQPLLESRNDKEVGGESDTKQPLLESRNDKEVDGESDTKQPLLESRNDKEVDGESDTKQLLLD